MNSYLDQKAEFTRDLAARLHGTGPDVLAERTGLSETTVRSLLAGHGELMSWEVVSACLAAAEADGEAVAEARGRWTAAEQAMWRERGEGPRAAFEKDPRGKPAKIVEMFQPRTPWRRLTARHPVTFEPWAEPVFDAPRRLPDPSSAADLREFYGLLAELRAWAGAPRQTEIERRSWGTLPDATVSAMLQKDRWRAASDREQRRIGYFAAACGLPETEVARWVEGYERLRYLPLPDDLARARAETAEAREHLAAARAEGAALRERLAAVQTEVDGLRARLTAAESGPETLPETVAGRAGPPDGPPAPRPGGRRLPGGRRTASAVVGAALFASGALLGGLAGGGPPQSACFDGTLRLIGSTAFERTAKVLARGYEELCPDASVVVDPVGSNEGVRALAAAGADAATTIAMHDGHLGADSDEVRLRGFQGFAVSLIAFAVIVHKDVNLTDLSVADLRSLYAEDSGPTNWKRLGGADLPIRMISRTEGSGTRTVFEERVLGGPEPQLSSRDCLRKDEIRAHTHGLRCERSSQGQVLEMVDRTPGAIGYAELHVAADSARYPGLRVLTLDGRRPDVSAEPGHYPFIAPEVFYTRGFAANGTPASAFLTFLGTGAARRILQRLGAPLCIGPAEPLAVLCAPA